MKEAMHQEGAKPEPAWLDRRVAGWATYDVASSAYVALVPTLFPLLYATVVLGGSPGADARFAAVAAVALLVAGIVTPLVGALADRGGLHRWLAGATIVCIGASAAMATLGPGQVLFAALLFVLAQAGYTVAMALYESFMPSLATFANMARVSAFGWAAGLGGGVLALAVTLLLVRGLPEAQGLDVAVLVAAGMFALFALPSLALLRRLLPRPANPGDATLGTAWRAVVADLRGWRGHAHSLRFLLAYLFINDAAVTIALTATLFIRQTFGTSLEGLVALLFAYSVLAAPATLGWGWVANRIGLPRAIQLNLVAWVAAVLAMIHVRGTYAPWLIVALLALVIASTNALCRAMYAQLVPRDRAAQFFGFNAVVGRMSAAMGPALYATIVATTGSSSAGLYAMLALFLAGGVVLATIELPRHPGVPALDGMDRGQ